MLFALTTVLARKEDRSCTNLSSCAIGLATSISSWRPATRCSGADHRELAAIALDEAQREQGLTQVALVFRYFEEWTLELLTFATAEL